MAKPKFQPPTGAAQAVTDEPILWFSQRLHAARRHRGVSAQKLAEDMGVSRARISAWENQRGFPDLKSFVLACQVLRASADYLLGLDLAMAAVPDKEILRDSPGAADAKRRANATPGAAAETELRLAEGPSAKALAALQGQMDIVMAALVKQGILPKPPAPTPEAKTKPRRKGTRTA